jgi:hypothetical protein
MTVVIAKSDEELPMIVLAPGSIDSDEIVES